MIWKVIACAALLGIVVPGAVLAIDSANSGGWWPHWLPLIWPSSYMLIGTAGAWTPSSVDVMAISIIVNAIVYAIVAAAAYGLAKLGRHTQSDRSA